MANINIRLDDNLKKEAEALFNDLGLNMTTATTIFLKQCLLCRGLPFEVRMDPFYSTDNQDHLCQGIANFEVGKGTVHQLTEIDNA